MPAHTLFDSLEAYRVEVRNAVNCPACKSLVGDKCRKLVPEHDQREGTSWMRAAEQVDYVHDDRSMEHANLMLVCP